MLFSWPCSGSNVSRHIQLDRRASPLNSAVGFSFFFNTANTFTSTVFHSVFSSLRLSSVFGICLISILESILVWPCTMSLEVLVSILSSWSLKEHYLYHQLIQRQVLGSQKRKQSWNRERLYLEDPEALLESNLYSCDISIKVKTHASWPATSNIVRSSRVECCRVLLST